MLEYPVFIITIKEHATPGSYLSNEIMEFKIMYKTFSVKLQIVNLVQNWHVRFQVQIIAV